jgi:hypothetical protein
MNVTLNRKQLAELLRQKDTSNIRQAIKRGSLIEDKNKLIDLQNPANRDWLETQIQAGRQKGFIIDIDLNDAPAKPGGDKNTHQNINDELKRARTELVREQIQTAQLNREIAFGNYLKTSNIIEAVKIYLDQTMNVANTNLSNAATRFCQQHGIKNPEDVIQLKSKLTDTLNLAIESGRDEVLKSVERMVSEQIEKLATK